MLQRQRQGSGMPSTTSWSSQVTGMQLRKVSRHMRVACSVQDRAGNMQLAKLQGSHMPSTTSVAGHGAAKKGAKVDILISGTAGNSGWVALQHGTRRMRQAFSITSCGTRSVAALAHSGSD
jgi:hypothetical protein